VDLFDRYLVDKDPRVAAGTGMPQWYFAEVVSSHPNVSGSGRRYFLRKFAHCRRHLALREIGFDLSDLSKNNAVV
jgi:hypothetical protein